MSVYGSLYSAVSGIRAQGVAIGIISDNISNVNTVGYKAGSQQFGTLVTSAGSASSYSPGGVRAQSRQLISQQGLVQTTSSPLDIAIQGNGMFVVSTGAGGISSGDSIAYSRAGNFGTDSNGNFLNAAGYYLQAWPLDSNGNIPSNSSSLNTLETVNIGEAFGEAAATTTVDLKVNLNAAETTLRGSGQIGAPGTDNVNTENQSISGSSIIVPNANLGLNLPSVAGSSSALAGDAAEISATGAGETAAQASVAAGNNAATAAAAAVAAAAGVAEITAVAGASALASAAGTAAITNTANVAAANAAGTVASDAATTAGLGAALGVDAQTSGDNARDAIIALAQITSTPGAVAAVTAAADAATAAAVLNGDSPADTRTAVTAAAAAAANIAVAAGTLSAAAISATASAGAVAVATANADFDGDLMRVTTGGSFSDDFVYGGFTGSNDIASGILGASTVTQPFNGAGVTSGDSFTIIVNGDTANPRTFTYVPSGATVENGEFSSMQTLSEAINAATGLNARVAEVNGGEFRLYVSSEDARQSLTFAKSVTANADFPAALGLIDVPATNANRWNTMEGLASLANTQTSSRLKAEVIDSSSTNARINIYNANPLTEIQFANVDDNTDPVAVGDFLNEFQISSVQQAPAYNAAAGSSALSMSAGNITPDFERTFSVFDSLGQEHEIRVGFVKVGTNSWRAELYATDSSEIVSTVTGPDAVGDRFIAAAAITFDGSGNLSSLSPNWLTNPPSVRWTSGASPSDIAFDLGTVGLKDGMSQSSGLYTSNVTQNGAAVGLLDTVSIDDQGFVVANFNNGQSKKLYKIPLATFSNYEGMQSRNGNVFIQTLASGDVNLAESGSGGAGSITPESLETSNSELSEELTDMIVAQRAYQASAKVITTADELLDELNRIT